MAYSQADILEADDKTIGALGVGLLFIAATAGLIGFVSQNTTIFQNRGVAEFLLQAFLAFGFLFILAIFANYKGMDILQDHAYAIIKWCYLISIGLFVGGLIIGGLLLLGSFIGILFIGFGLLVLFLFSRGWPFIRERIRRAAEWLQISVTIVLNEPGMIVLALIQSIIVGITVIMEAITIYAWNAYSQAMAYSQNTANLIAYGIMFLYLWLSLSVIYYFDGANTFISYARIHNKDPTVGQGLNAASNKFLAIIGYALLSAIVTFLTRLLFFRSIEMETQGRSEGNIGKVILAVVLRILSDLIQWLYHLISFFTLPAIIIRQKNTKEAMIESKNLFTRTFWDMIISDMGYSYGSTILYVVTGLILSVAGFFYGYFVASAYLAVGQVIVGILMAIIALVFGLFASRFFLKPLYTALVTTIYVFATEGPEALEIVPKRLSGYLENQSRNPKYIPTNNQRSIRF